MTIASFVVLSVASDDVLLTSANTTPMTVVDKAIRTFQIQSVSYSQTIYLVKDVACNLLLRNGFIHVIT